MYRLPTLIIVVGCLLSASISSQSSSNLIHDLSLKIHNETNMESHPRNEGFLMMSENQPKHAKKVDHRIFTPNSTSTTTCRTVVIVKTKKQTSTPRMLDHSIGHLSRRLLDDEPHRDTNNEEIDSFMKVDDEELSKQLLRMELTMDGSGETTESTTQSTTTTTTPSEEIILSNKTMFILELNCSNAKNITEEIINALKLQFGHSLIIINQSEPRCDPRSNKANVSIEFETENTVEILTELLQDLDKITDEKGVTLFSDNLCDSGTVVPEKGVDSCRITRACGLCGTNPTRGVCLPEYNETGCVCLPNRYDSSIIYTGPFCYTTVRPLSRPSDWTPVIVGVVAGIAGLFFLVTACLWVMAVWPRPINPNVNNLPVRRLWHLPRAQVPTSGASENAPDYSNNTPSTTSSQPTDSDYNPNNTTDSTFFKELDQRMGENLRATRTRPNTSGMLAGLPSNTNPTSSNYDPIDELDAIIDNEDTNNTFHDPLNDFFDDNDVAEAINPNFQIPRPNF